MKIRFNLIVIIALVSFSCSERLTSVINVEDKTSTSNNEIEDTFSGEMIVEFSEDFAEQLELSANPTKSVSAYEELSAVGITEIERLFPDAGEWEMRHRAAGLHLWYRVKYNPDVPQTKASATLESMPFVKSAQPERRIKTTEFNDPDFSRQWHYYNSGANKYVECADVNVVPVWDNFTSGTSNVIVAVLDGGIQMDHPDLNGVVIPAGENGSKNFIYGQIGYNIIATTHGTHVAGTIGAKNNNGIGGCGVAGGSDGNGGVKLLSCQMISEEKDENGNSLQGNEYNAMVWAADHGAVISQNSWAYVYKTEADAANADIGAMKVAIDYFIEYAGTDKNGNQLPDSPMKGGVVFFAAGNETWQHAWPPEYSKVIAVGAMNAQMSRSSYSNYGDWVDICAPGGDAGIDSKIYSTIPNGEYACLQGTSMACPHVSGVAALIVSYFGGPGFTNEMLIERLLEGANYDTDLKSQKIGPLVDAYGSFLSGGTEAPEAVSQYSVTASSNRIKFSWNVTQDQDSPSGKAYAYLLLASTSREDFDNLDSKSPPTTISCTAVKVGEIPLGDEIEGLIENLEFDTDYYVALAGYDFNRNYSSLSDIKSVRTMPNNPPVIECDATNNIQIRRFETKSIGFHMYDPDAHSFLVTYTPGSSAEKWVKVDDNNYTMSIVGTNAPEGDYVAYVAVSDCIGDKPVSTVQYSLNYSILANGKPMKIKDIDNRVFTGLGETAKIDMKDYITDPDGEDLKFEITHSNSFVTHLNPVGSIMTLTTLNYGVDEITVKALDCMGESCETSFEVCVTKDAGEINIYPTSVKDKLYISSVTECEVHLEIVSSSGKVVYECTGNTSMFEPMIIDMNGFAHGLYSVIVTCNGEQTVRTIAKL